MADASTVVGTPEAPGVFAPNFASYNWIGAPANFTGYSSNLDTGGDSTAENLNKWFQSGDQAYIIVASAMVRKTELVPPEMFADRHRRS